jgi:hypothetical protein
MGKVFVISFYTISYLVILAKGNICGCIPFKDCNWSRSTLKMLINMSKDDPSRSEKIDLITRNTCDLKKRTVQCCGPEEAPKEVIQQNFLQDFLTSPSSTVKTNSKRNVRTWNESEFCQLHLYTENHMNSTPFVSVSHEIKKFKVGYTTRTYRITSSFDTDCCWRIKKNRKLLRNLRNNKIITRKQMFLKEWVFDPHLL